MSTWNIIGGAIGLALACYGIRHKLAEIDFDAIIASLWAAPIIAALLPLALYLLATSSDAIGATGFSDVFGGAAILVAFILAPIVGLAGMTILLLKSWSKQISLREPRMCLAMIFACLDLLPAIPIIFFIVSVMRYGLHLDS